MSNSISKLVFFFPGFLFLTRFVFFFLHFLWSALYFNSFRKWILFEQNMNFHSENSLVTIREKNQITRRRMLRMQQMYATNANEIIDWLLKNCPICIKLQHSLNFSFFCVNFFNFILKRSCISFKITLSFSLSKIIINTNTNLKLNW